jgi:mRNA interferase RelE/StbE
MRRVYSERFQRSFAAAPRAVQKACDKQLNLLVLNLRHPSVRAKKFDASRNIWQGRINRNWRFYFTIEGDAYYLIDMVSHPQ